MAAPPQATINASPSSVANQGLGRVGIRRRRLDGEAESGNRRTDQTGEHCPRDREHSARVACGTRTPELLSTEAVNRRQLGNVDVVIRFDRHAPEDTRRVMSHVQGCGPSSARGPHPPASRAAGGSPGASNRRVDTLLRPKTTTGRFRGIGDAGSSQIGECHAGNKGMRRNLGCRSRDARACRVRSRAGVRGCASK